MITEDYVSFETARLLKKKGFDETCDFVYDEDKLEWILHKFIFLDGKISTNSTFNFDGIISAPTLQMAMKWLREMHGIHIEICLDTLDGLTPTYRACYSVITNISTNNFIDFANTYEEACEAAIKYCLENLI